MPALWSWAHCLSLQAWTLSPASERRQWAALVPFGSPPAERRARRRTSGWRGGSREWKSHVLLGIWTRQTPEALPLSQSRRVTTLPPSTGLQASSLSCPFGNTGRQWAGGGGFQKGCPDTLGSSRWPGPSPREQGPLAPWRMPRHPRETGFFSQTPETFGLQGRSQGVFKTWASFMAITTPFLSPGSGPELARTPSAS